MKYAISLMTVAAFAFAMSVSPVAASSYEWGGHHQSSDTTVGVNVEDTTVTNNTSTNANTGYNSVSGSGRVRGTINTGNAVATSFVTNYVNGVTTTVTADCGCNGDLDVEVNVEDTTVTNNTSTNANTGHSSVSGSGNYYHYWYWFGPYTQGGVRGTINTGDATAVSDVLNEVNTVVTRVTR